jgi:LysM repeat protein
MTRLVANAPKPMVNIPAPEVTAPDAVSTSLATTAVKTPVVASQTTMHKAIVKPEYTTYIAKKHDTLENVAEKNHLTVARLREANNLNSDYLRMGQRLNIPIKTHVTAIASAKPAKKDATGTENVAWVSASTTAPDKIAKASKTTTHLAAATTTHHRTYIVAKGDTLIKIAHEFKTTPKALMAVNDISNPKKLTIGKQLKIPAESHTSHTKASATQLANNVEQ